MHKENEKEYDAILRVTFLYNSARSYCEFIEKISERDPKNLWFDLVEMLSAVAHAVCQVKKLDVAPLASDKDYDALHVGDTEYEKICSSVTAVLEPLLARSRDAEIDLHGESELHCDVLVDDLADLYRDLKMGVRIYEEGSPVAVRDAVFHWLDLFGFHWGAHLFGGLHKVYTAYISDPDRDPGFPRLPNAGDTFLT